MDPDEDSKTITGEFEKEDRCDFCFRTIPLSRLKPIDQTYEKFICDDCKQMRDLFV